EQRTDRHLSSGGEVISQRTPSTGSMQFGRVCEACNCGWMSKLESKTSLLIKQLIQWNHARHCVLLADDADILSLWAYKTALMLNVSANYRRIVPEAHYHHLYEHKKIPENVFVDIGVTGPAIGGL